MAETRVQPGLSPTIWDDKFSVEFFQNNPFSAYAGTGTDNPIVMKEDFKSAHGNGITFEFITNLERGSIKGYQPLRGHEDRLGEFGDRVFWTMRKKGISLHELDVDLAAIDLRKAAKGNLKTWADEDVKYEVIARLQDVGIGLNVPLSDASGADVNAWQAANADRIFYGGGRSNYVPGAHSTSLANITAAGGRFTRASCSMLKRMALTARPRITPVQVSESDNRRMYVAFVHPFIMRDIIADLSSIESAVRIISKNEGLFLGGDRDWDGVIIHELDEAPVYPGVGSGGIDVAPVFLLGAEALAWAIKSRYSSREQLDDYQQVEGLAMIGKWGIKKAGYTIGDPSRTVTANDGTKTNIIGKQRGMVSGFFACISD